MTSISNALYHQTTHPTVILVFIAGAFLAPAATATPAVVHAGEVKSCHYLGQVNGHSKHGKHHDWKHSAKASALSHANKRGATHVVWDHFTPIGAFNGVAVANLYDCGHHHHKQPHHK